LVIAFAVAELFFNDDSHIMTVAIPSGATVTGPPLDATFPKPHWYNDNMVLWYDEKDKAMVMIFQEGCYSCREGYGYDDWMNSHKDALNQSIWKTVSYDDGLTWSGKVQLLDGQVLDPRVQYQIIPSHETDDEGYATEVMIPVHRWDEEFVENNYQMLWRTNRAIDPDDDSWRVVNMTNFKHKENFGGHIQTTIFRPSGDANLVAFLRDRNGHWIHRTTSDDDGQTWSVQLPTPLGNSDLISQAIALHNGRIMLFHNPQQSYGYWPAENRDDNAYMLTVSISDNAGLSWMHERVLEYANDGKSLYPVALQDPLCSNVYLAYSVEVNEQGPGLNCDTLYITSDQEYQACLEKSITIAFIKFTVIHESWVLDNHNWKLDYVGCVWNIAKTIQDEISDLKKSYRTGMKTSSLFSSDFDYRSPIDSGLSLSTYTLILAIVLVCLICCALGICWHNLKLPRKRTRKLSPELL